MDTKSLSLEVAKFTMNALFIVEVLHEDGSKFRAEQLTKQIRDLNAVLIRILEFEV